MQTLTLKPHDLRVGDLVSQLQDDYSTLDVAVTSVESIRPHGATVYEVILADDPEGEHPIYLQANASIAVRRPDEADAVVPTVSNAALLSTFASLTHGVHVGAHQAREKRDLVEAEILRRMEG